MVRLSKKYGYELLVLGFPDQKDFAVSKGIKPENYFSADIGNHSDKNLDAIKRQMRDIAKTRRIDAVKTYLNAYALLEAELADALAVPGYSPDAVRNAHSKIRARELMNLHPDARLHLPALTAADESAARQAFARIRAAGFSKVVAKPDSGGGGWGVTLNIDSPDAAAAAYRTIVKQIEDLIAADPRKAESKQVDQKPSVLFEGQIPDGLMLDAEVIVRDGRIAFLNFAYNQPALGNQERGTTYPAVLSPEIRALAASQVRGALQAVGLKTGNAHVELIATTIGGKLAVPIVEINARMGGADIWASVRESMGVDVMEEGLRAAFSLESEAKPASVPVLLQHRFFIARTAGRVKAVRGLPQAGNEIFLSEMFVSPGARVGEKDLLGNITVRGATERAALDRLFALLRGVEIDIETDDGTVVTQTGMFGHDTAEAAMVSADWVDRIDAERAGWLKRVLALVRRWLSGSR
jgi:biotin carboxylase